MSSFTPLIEGTDNKYVIGFEGTVKYISGFTIENNKMVKNLGKCIDSLKKFYKASKVHRYFIPTDMGFKTKFASDNKKITFAVEDGYQIPALKDISEYNNKIHDIIFDNKANHYKIITSHVNVKGKIRKIYTVVHINTSFLESSKKYSAEGQIKRNASDRYEDCGKIKYHRYGPAKQIDDVETGLQRVSHSITKYKFNANLSKGHYHQSSIVWPKGNEYLLNKEFIIKDKENTNNFTIPWIPNSVKGHIYDVFNQSLKGKKLVLRSTCDYTLKKYATSDNEGFFDFKDVDIGEYEILVDGKPKAVAVQRGSGDEVDVKDESLWRFSVKFIGTPVLRNGFMEIKKFKLDCENPKDQEGSEYIGKICAEVYPENENITYGGSLTKSDVGLPLQITTYGINFDANTRWVEAPISEDISSVAYRGGDTHNIYNTCVGNFPPHSLEYIKEHKRIHFTSYGTEGATCIFTLEPCRNNSCDDNGPQREDFDEFDDFDTGTQSESSNMTPGNGPGDG